MSGSFIAGFTACYLLTAVLHFAETMRSPEFRGEWLAVSIASLTWPMSFLYSGDDA